MPEKPPSAFRLGPLAKRRQLTLATELDKPESAILEIAITHLLAALQARRAVLMTHSDDNDTNNKRPPRAA